MKVKILRVAVDSLGTVPKNLEKGPEELEINWRIEPLPDFLA